MKKNKHVKIESIGIVEPKWIVKGYEHDTVLVFQYIFDSEEEAKEAAKDRG